MTDKQKQRIKDQIAKIKRTLAFEKRKFGGFDDSRGLRYLPTSLYMKIEDYEGGLKYLRWFNKNFPDDIGFPEFLFESMVLLFKAGKMNDAEHYALKTYFSNTFLIDKYFSKEPKNLYKKVSIGFQHVDYLKNFNYRHDQDDLLEFSEWLSRFIQSDKFLKSKDELDEIEKQLETEPVGLRRTRLVNRLYKLI